ncbi:DUF4129 domain-containing protein [Thermostilla marina]
MRPRRTEIDWMLTLLNLGLVMLLVGSLAFFLLEVFYQGRYSGRLHWIVGLFVFAVVLTSEIAIESGRERASLFAVPLAVATWIALQRFVQFSGVLMSFSFMVNALVLAVTWWSAARLTFDCVVLDDDVDQEGKGLLEKNGEKRVSPIAVSVFLHRVEEWLAIKRSGGRRGRTVVWFSIAAVPLFGIGQSFGRGSPTALRFLAVYLAAALLLLATTSLLEQRAYLRYRRFQLPRDVTLRRLATAVGFVVVVLGGAWILPRPEEIRYGGDILATTRELTANRFGWGSEGVKGESWQQASPGEGEERSEEDFQSTSSHDADSTDEVREQNAGSHDVEGSPEEVGNASRHRSPPAAHGGDEARTAETRSRENGSDSNASDTPTSHDADSADRSRESTKDRARESSKSAVSASREEAAKSTRTGDRFPANEASNRHESRQRRNGRSAQRSTGQQREPARDAGPSEKSVERRKFPPLPKMPTFQLTGVFRVLVWLIFLGVIAWFVIRHRAAVFEVLREWWTALFARKKQGAGDVATEESAEARRRRTQTPFSAYGDPFADDVLLASRDRMAAYLFAALESWGTGHGCPRAQGETPKEYARRLGGRFPQIEQELKTIGHVYSLVVYTHHEDIPPDKTERESFERLWRYLRRHAPIETPMTHVTGE